MHRSLHIPRSRYPHQGRQMQFYLIYISSLFSLIAMGWAAALFL